MCLCVYSSPIRTLPFFRLLLTVFIKLKHSGASTCNLRQGPSSLSALSLNSGRLILNRLRLLLQVESGRTFVSIVTLLEAKEEEEEAEPSGGL